MQMVKLITLVELKVNSLTMSLPQQTSFVFFLRSSRLGNESLKAEIRFFMWFKHVTLKDLSGMQM